MIQSRIVLIGGSYITDMEFYTYLFDRFESKIPKSLIDISINPNEASDLVIKSIEEINRLKGKVFSKKMKSAKISNILDIWTSIYDCSWKKITGIL